MIFFTCMSARRNALLEALLQKTAPEIRQVVMDEAGQAPEPEALCLLTLARYEGGRAGRVERLATRCRNDDSDICSPVSLLAEQYRMHPSISRFPRRHFYRGRVKDHPSVKDRIRCVLHHRGSGAPFLVWTGHSSGEELQCLRTIGSGGVGSRANNEEATRAVSLAARLARHVGESAVAVLSFTTTARWQRSARCSEEKVSEASM